MADARFASDAEAYRAVIMLREAMERLDFVKTISYGSQRDGEADNFVGDDISALIRDQHSYQEQYAVLAERKSQLNGLLKAQELKDVTLEMDKISRNLKHINSQICKVLKDRPNVKENLKKIESERARLYELFDTSIQSLLKDSSYGAAVEYKMELIAKAQRLEQRKAEDKALMAELKGLLKQHQNLQSDFDRETREGNEEIRELREQVQKQRVKSALTIQLQEATNVAREQALLRLLQQEHEECEARLRALELQNEMDRAAHAEARSVMLKQQRSLNERVDDVGKDVESAEVLFSKLSTKRYERDRLVANISANRSALAAAEAELEVDVLREEARKEAIRLKQKQFMEEDEAIKTLIQAARIYAARKKVRDAGKKKKKKKAKKKK